jgi:hypothetical protein
MPDPPTGVPFEPTPGTTPSRAVTLSRDLGLEPDLVPNPQTLPDVPPHLTADVPQRSRGDIEPQFDAQFEADRLARDLGLDVPTLRDPDAIDYTPPSMENQMVGDQRIAPPREMEQLDLDASADQPRRLSLSQSGPGNIKVSRSGDQLTVRHKEGGEISAIDLPERGVIQIQESLVPEGGRGKGRGKAMVEKLRRENPDRQIWSGERVSKPAQEMWESLERSGVKIKRNPATRNASGELVSKSELKPVYEIVNEADVAEVGDAIAAGN